MINDRNTKINVFIIMINEEVLTEKLKYLITTNAKLKQFDVMNIFIDFEYADQNRQKLGAYDVDVEFDYEGALDFDMYNFAHDIQRMSEKLRDVVNEYVISQEGKIVSRENSNCYTTEAMVYHISYEVDTKHVFNLGYKFNYEEE
jgi:hypothetical protein